MKVQISLPLMLSINISESCLRWGQFLERTDIVSFLNCRHSLMIKVCRFLFFSMILIRLSSLKVVSKIRQKVYCAHRRLPTWCSRWPGNWQCRLSLIESCLCFWCRLTWGFSSCVRRLEFLMRFYCWRWWSRLFRETVCRRGYQLLPMRWNSFWSQWKIQDFPQFFACSFFHQWCKRTFSNLAACPEPILPNLHPSYCTNSKPIPPALTNSWWFFWHQSYTSDKSYKSLSS